MNKIEKIKKELEDFKNSLDEGFVKEGYTIDDYKYIEMKSEQYYLDLIVIENALKIDENLSYKDYEYIVLHINDFLIKAKELLK